MKLPRVLFLRADLKGVERELHRVADCLEVLILEQYHIRMTPTPAPDRDESDVLYGDEEKYALQDARDLGQFKRPDRPIDVEEFPE